MCEYQTLKILPDEGEENVLIPYPQRTCLMEAQLLASPA